MEALGNGKIKIETSSEIEHILEALENSEYAENKDVQALINILTDMAWSW